MGRPRHECPVCWEPFVANEDGTFTAEETSVHAECIDGPPDNHLTRIAHSFAMKYGLRNHLAYPAALALEADLTMHLKAWAGR